MISHTQKEKCIYLAHRNIRDRERQKEKDRRGREGNRKTETERRERTKGMNTSDGFGASCPP